MRHLAASLGVVATLIAGCGLNWADRPIDDALIGTVGAGSDAANLVPILEARVNEPSSFNMPRDRRLIILLVQGQIGKLTQNDRAHLTKSSLLARKDYDDGLVAIDNRLSELRAARVNVDADNGLSAGDRRFADAWNGYLVLSADRARMLRRTFLDVRTAFDEYVILLRAANDTAGMRSTDEFAKVNKRVAGNLRGLTALRGKVLDRIFIVRRADRILTDLVNTDANAQAIVEKVNERHPHGVLAGMFKNG